MDEKEMAHIRLRALEALSSYRVETLASAIMAADDLVTWALSGSSPFVAQSQPQPAELVEDE